MHRDRAINTTADEIANGIREQPVYKMRQSDINRLQAVL